MITFTLEDEDVNECEYAYYVGGHECFEAGTKVILEHDDDNSEPDMHIGHLCADHADIIWPTFEALNLHGSDTKSDPGDTLQHEVNA